MTDVARPHEYNKWLHDDVIKCKYFPRYRPFVRGIHRSPVNSPPKGQWRGALMLSLIWACTNSWANNGDAGDLRRHGTHYDVVVMFLNPIIGHKSEVWVHLAGYNNVPGLLFNLMFFYSSTYGIVLREHRYVFVFCIIPTHWDGAGSWNHSLWKAGVRTFYAVNNMAAYGLAT